MTTATPSSGELLTGDALERWIYLEGLSDFLDAIHGNFSGLDGPCDLPAVVDGDTGDLCLNPPELFGLVVPVDDDLLHGERHYNRVYARSLLVTAQVFAALDRWAHEGGLALAAEYFAHRSEECLRKVEADKDA
jgi:hypothetical protein